VPVAFKPHVSPQKFRQAGLHNILEQLNITYCYSFYLKNSKRQENLSISDIFRIRRGFFKCGLPNFCCKNLRFFWNYGCSQG